MVRATALALALFAAGCDDPARMRTEAEIADIADDVAADHVASAEARIAELEARIANLEDRLEAESGVNRALSSYVRAVDDTVANNARIANEKTLREATARGECGTELVQTSPGSWYNRPIPCTAENYWGRPSN